MQLWDVNVLVSSHRREDPSNDAMAEWLRSTIASGAAVGLPSIVLSAFLRIVSNPRAFRDPTPIDIALAYVEDLLAYANVRVVQPGPSHWKVFADLCHRLQPTGNQVPDVYLSAMAIDGGCVWVSADRGFDGVPGLRWRDPRASH